VNSTGRRHAACSSSWHRNSLAATRPAQHSGVACRRPQGISGGARGTGRWQF
jgi:hypothetical protein